MQKKEQLEQIAVSNYIKNVYPRILFTIAPSGMKLSHNVAGKFKAMGYSAGTPDIMIFQPNKKYHGLFIELKLKELRDADGRVYQRAGKPTGFQREWIARLNEAGYCAVICYGSRSAMDFIDTYMLLIP